MRDAEAHAAEAEQRVAKALAQADKVRTDAEQHAKELLSNARRNADRVVAEAREHAEKQISDSMIESERERTSATRQVEDLNRQRESITSYLDELRNLLGHNPDRATLERASRAEAAFEKEQKSAPARPRRRPRVPTRPRPGEAARPASRPTKSRPAPVCRRLAPVRWPEPDAIRRADARAGGRRREVRRGRREDRRHGRAAPAPTHRRARAARKDDAAAPTR